MVHRQHKKKIKASKVTAGAKTKNGKYPTKPNKETAFGNTIEKNCNNNFKFFYMVPKILMRIKKVQPKPLRNHSNEKGKMINP